MYSFQGWSAQMLRTSMMVQVDDNVCPILGLFFPKMFQRKLMRAFQANKQFLGG